MIQIFSLADVGKGQIENGVLSLSDVVISLTLVHTIFMTLDISFT